jgi:branched-chain amino acid transport system permease protein
MTVDPGTIVPLAVSLEALTDPDFWISVGVLAGIYAMVGLGLQVNTGFTGIVNFGAAGFMAIGAYSMAILVLDAGISFWLALPLAMVITMLFGVLVGLPSLRLRADYFAIATIALAEMVRLFAQNARDLTGGNQGLFCADDDPSNCYTNSWRDVSESINDDFVSNFWSDPATLFPLLLVVWATVGIATVALIYLQRSPWGRVLRAIREDEDAARALGKNTLLFKLQSLALAALLGAVGGFFLALNLATLHPIDFEPLVTFFAFSVLVLGGLANYKGVAVGAVLFWFVIEGTRFIELPDPPFTETRIAALRLAITGLLLIGLMAYRPEGLFGKRQEMVLGE